MKQTYLFRRNVQSVAAFALGATAGTLIALLYAPASGQVTRKRLAQKVRRLQRNAARQLQRTQHVFVTKAGKMQQAASGWINDHLPTNGRVIRRRRAHHAAAN